MNRKVEVPIECEVDWDQPLIDAEYRIEHLSVTHVCEWCRESIGLLDAQTSTGRVSWHTRCWNEAWEARAAALAESDDA